MQRMDRRTDGRMDGKLKVKEQNTEDQMLGLVVKVLDPQSRNNLELTGIL